MKQILSGFALPVMAVIIALGAKTATATSVQDLVRMKGQDRVFLQGLGLVVGLAGTGDSSKDSWVMTKPYAMLLENLGDPVTSLNELKKADAIALVYVTMEVPEFGAVDGDQMDVQVETAYNATSLEGGRLVFSPLRLPAPHAANPPLMAYAQGKIILEGTDLTSGRVRNGGQMVHDIKTNPVSNGRVELILKDEYAGYPMAARLADIVNSTFEFSGVDRLAAAENAKSVHVLVPTADRADPAPFIAALLSTPVDPTLIEVGARIVINEQTETIIVTKDVEIGPVAISHANMRMNSISPEYQLVFGQGTAEPTQGTWIGLDVRKGDPRQSTHLNTMLEQMRGMNVPVKDQIQIIYELQRSGALHAEIISE